MTEKSDTKALLRAAGKQHEIAATLGVSHAAVRAWSSRGMIPEAQMPAINAMIERRKTGAVVRPRRAPKPAPPLSAEDLT